MRLAELLAMGEQERHKYLAAQRDAHPTEPVDLSDFLHPDHGPEPAVSNKIDVDPAEEAAEHDDYS